VSTLTNWSIAMEHAALPVVSSHLHWGNQRAGLILLTTSMLQDMLDIIDLEGRREPGTFPSTLGGFDLIWSNGAVQQFDCPTSLPTLLGCFNPSDKNQARRPYQEDGSRSTRLRKTRSNNAVGGSSSSSSSSRSSRSSCASAGSTDGGGAGGNGAATSQCTGSADR